MRQQEILYICHVDDLKIVTTTTNKKSVLASMWASCIYINEGRRRPMYSVIDEKSFIMALSSKVHERFSFSQLATFCSTFPPTLIGCNENALFYTIIDRLHDKSFLHIIYFAMGCNSYTLLDCSPLIYLQIFVLVPKPKTHNPLEIPFSKDKRVCQKKS